MDGDQGSNFRLAFSDPTLSFVFYCRKVQNA